MGEEPVAITKRRAVMRAEPAWTVLRSTKWPASSITRTPSPVKRSTESLGAMTPMTPWTCACTAS